MEDIILPLLTVVMAITLVVVILRYKKTLIGKMALEKEVALLEAEKEALNEVNNYYERELEKVEESRRYGK